MLSGRTSCPKPDTIRWKWRVSLRNWRPGPQPPQFLSDHPNPGNRERAIRAEMQTLPTRSYGYQTGEFQRMKSEVAGLPPAPNVRRNQ